MVFQLINITLLKREEGKHKNKNNKYFKNDIFRENEKKNNNCLVKSKILKIFALIIIVQIIFQMFSQKHTINRMIIIITKILVSK